MPPRFAYWTILIDGKPTAFRARDREELLPTVTQLKRTNQDVLLRWFARGKLWESPDAERASRQRRDKAAAARGTREVRGRDWRPGGRHQDPRQPFRDDKKQRNQERRAARHARRERTTPWSGKPPRGKHPPRDARAREDAAPRRADEGTPPPPRPETPDRPPQPEQIVTKPKPPERG